MYAKKWTKVHTYRTDQQMSICIRTWRSETFYVATNFRLFVHITRWLVAWSVYMIVYISFVIIWVTWKRFKDLASDKTFYRSLANEKKYIWFQRKCFFFFLVRPGFHKNSGNFVLQSWITGLMSINLDNIIPSPKL